MNTYYYFVLLIRIHRNHCQINRPMAERITRRKRPTQADVARLARVSQTTVSHVLNNNDVALPLETRQRILDAMAELGYEPDRTARSLRTSKTYTIASIIPDIANPFYPRFLRGIQDVADQFGYDLVMYNTDGIAEKEQKCLSAVRQGRADGMIGVLFHMTAEDLHELLERNVAVVRFEARPQEVGDYPLDSLYVDNVAAARTATTYLIERGHSRIGMIAGALGPRAMRVLGYRQALGAHKIPVDDALIRETGFTEQGGYDGMKELLRLSTVPSAVFAANDLMALGALVAIREAGLHVPGDIAIVGFDDIPVARLVNPPLTTVAQFAEQIGRRAAEMVLERLTGEMAEGGRCEEMPHQLIVRESA
jgi:LacI family transcriptional regulator